MKEDINLCSIKHAALELTNLCNLECTHCYTSSSPKEKISRYMTKDDWMNAIQDLKSAGCNSIQFIGGEPTVHPDLPHLIKYACQNGISNIQVYTNGVSISNELMSVFVANNVNLAFSVYSHDPQLHDAVTKTSGSYKRTEKSIKKAIDSGLNVAVGIITVDLGDNLEIEKTISYVESLGVSRDEIGVDRVRSFGRGENLINFEDKYSELCGRCWSERVVINDEGNVSPCVMSKFVKLGHISSGLKNVLQSDIMKDFHLKKPKHLSDKGNFLENSCSPGTQCRCPKPVIQDIRNRVIA